jgi:HEAT repeat protein
LNLAKAMIMANASEREVRTGIEILSQIGSPEALKEIGQKLLDDRPGVRISCLVALNGRAPQEFRAQILERRRDPDARVRAVAARIDPGR